MDQNGAMKPGIDVVNRRALVVGVGMEIDPGYQGISAAYSDISGRTQPTPLSHLLPDPSSVDQGCQDISTAYSDISGRTQPTPLSHSLPDPSSVGMIGVSNWLFNTGTTSSRLNQPCIMDEVRQKSDGTGIAQEDGSLLFWEALLLTTTIAFMDSPNQSKVLANRHRENILARRCEKYKKQCGSRKIITTEPILEPTQCSESDPIAEQNEHSECRSAPPAINDEELVVEPVITSEQTSSSACGCHSPSPIPHIMITPLPVQLSFSGKPFRPSAKWYLLRVRDVETKFHARTRSWTSCVNGATFEIDDEEEALQMLLDELHQCTEGILNVAGVGKTYHLVENIIQDVALVHSWLFEIQTDIFVKGHEYVVYQHRKGALLYQQDN
ncbi:hypothetical protein EDD18DRAFT_1101949 [Armillaria luteobubalina]|uniref:Uncharacterized protein n=1 Tax=Armillaria luteobubalina TaxID=153913 RepID=A0AA39TUJ7_9AGAR|nr:hypothetical protein EDD18DRAFT_1101949 [Armillaria luteobubalina]